MPRGNPLGTLIIAMSQHTTHINSTSMGMNNTIVAQTYNTTCKSSLSVEGDLIVAGVNIADTLTAIQERLLILVPDPKKLEQYEALKLAYNHYLMIEKLCADSEK